ncbi:MAG: hypothetical protein Q9163_004177 [Psora crenata]
MSSSDLSELTLDVSTDDEALHAPVNKTKLDHYFNHGSNATQTPPPLKKKRPPSPPHEYVLADNPDIAFICMFRSRFSDAFQKSLPHYGPQDIENGVVGPIPGEHVERLLCALLGLVLNRKKDIECVVAPFNFPSSASGPYHGHYTRALEEAIHAHTNQWPTAWQGRNPLHGGGSFNNMNDEQRLTLMKSLIIWSLESSDAVKAIIKESYKQTRHDDDLNQPLSVQPWGRDGDKRRFWLIEGQDDTHFRLYRDSNRALKHNTWRSIAGTVDEVKEVADKLGEENTQASRRLRDRILAAIPRFEASEEVSPRYIKERYQNYLTLGQKRRRRDYRLARKAQFIRPEPGFSLYEGRTRGKRIRYTYSDEEGAGSDGVSGGRSNRNSGISSPAEPAGPKYTASGRQIRSRHGRLYGESLSSGKHEPREANGGSHIDIYNGEDDRHTRGRPRRVAQSNGVKSNARARETSNGLDLSSDSDHPSDDTFSGHEWDGGDEDEPNTFAEDDEEDVDMSDESDSRDSLGDTDAHRSLIVSLRYAKVGSSPAPAEGVVPKESANHATALRAQSAATANVANMLDVPPPAPPQSAPTNVDQPPRSSGQEAIPSQPTPSGQAEYPSGYEPPLNTFQHGPQRAPSLVAQPSLPVSTIKSVLINQAVSPASDKPPPSHYPTPGRAPPSVSLP